MQKTLTDTDFIDEDIADCERELDILTEMIRQTVMQNASASVSEEEYRRRYNDLTDRFRAEEEKYKQLTARRNRMEAESVSIGGILIELQSLKHRPLNLTKSCGTLWSTVLPFTTMTAWCIL